MLVGQRGNFSTTWPTMPRGTTSLELIVDQSFLITTLLVFKYDEFDCLCIILL